MASFLHVDLQIAAIEKRRTVIILAKLYRFYFISIVKMMIKYIILLYVAFKTTYHIIAVVSGHNS
jgi:hypothetical protein